MVGIILSVVALCALAAIVIVLWGKIANGEEEFFGGCCAIIILAGFLGLFVIPLAIRTCDGLYYGYSDGIREGYIVKVSTKGVVWKTVDVQVQIGTGAQAAIQGPEHFSVTPSQAAKVQASLGKKAKIYYKEWLVVPYRVGDASKVIEELEVLD